MGTQPALAHLEALLDEWNELRDADRDAFLARLSASDQAALGKVVGAAPQARKWFDRAFRHLHPSAAETCPEDLPVGYRVAHLQIEGLIRHGGMSCVYEATNTLTGERIALKLVDLRSVKNYQQFLNESRIVSKLNHENICALHSYGFTDDDKGYMEMPLYRGQILRDRMQGRPLPYSDIVDIVRQVACGLDAAHEKGVIHRDIKPENLFILENGRTRILDFGVARLVSRDPSTAAGMLKGTIPYVSPECITNPPVGPETDFWSLGVLTYEMVSGKQPFRGEGLVETMNAILSSTPDPLPELPENLERLIARCLEKDPRKRISAAQDVYDLIN